MINASTKQSYFNNTKLANSLSLIPSSDGTLEVHEFGKYGKMIVTRSGYGYGFIE